MTLEKDIAGAKTTLALANEYTQKIKDDIARGNAQLTLAKQMMLVGNADEYEKNCPTG